MNIQTIALAIFTISIASIISLHIIVQWAQSNFARRARAINRKCIIPLIVLGSGGHTTEMFRLLEGLPRAKYGPRIYVIANTDRNSASKVSTYENNASQSESELDQYTVEVVPRSREVKQSWISSVWTTAYATLFSAMIMLKHQPDLVICNGPGTCVPFCLLVVFFRSLRLLNTKMIYVESFARVSKLSLTGKILYRIVDTFVVQWPQLQERYPKATYVGRLV